MKNQVYGNTEGLRHNRIKLIETLYQHQTRPEYIADPELVRALVHFSHDIRRQIGILIDRNGKIVHVMVGDSQGIVIPVLSDYMAHPGKLKGLRLVHTHLREEPLTRDDLTDLALLRLDYITAVGIRSEIGRASCRERV